MNSPEKTAENLGLSKGATFSLDLNEVSPDNRGNWENITDYYNQFWG